MLGVVNCRRARKCKIMASGGSVGGARRVEKSQAVGLGVRGGRGLGLLSERIIEFSLG